MKQTLHLRSVRQWSSSRPRVVGEVVSVYTASRHNLIPEFLSKDHFLMEVIKRSVTSIIFGS